jgi:predicted component of type VI protein secretion system
MAEAICPNGHLSDTADYCDQCGAKIGGDPSVAAAPAAAATSTPAPSAAAGPTKACPACGAPNAEGDKFCEVCGYDMALGAPGAASPAPAPVEAPAPAEAASPAPAAAPSSSPFSTPAVASGRAFAAPSWQAIVVADRDYYDRMQAEEIPFPAVYPDRIFSLTTLRAVIGRRSASRGINPEIDLSGAPEDPGVSHMHAVLVGSPEGGWTLIDPGSANGTFLNDSTDPIDTNRAVPVSDGDRIHMGAWTTLTLRKT